MNVTVRLFARARELAGQSEVCVNVPEGSTVAELRHRLGQTCPELKSLLPHLMFAVDNEYVSEARCLGPTVEVAAFPPVSGG